MTGSLLASYDEGVSREVGGTCLMVRIDKVRKAGGRGRRKGKIYVLTLAVNVLDKGQQPHYGER